ncbi:hypothetical protein LZ683_08765 [Comamonas testosteroni]|uniref:hypothetical protein n=1 Tax=Comamonas testosteroni TaxID=285 RepID=UPI0023AADA61|nr:hypothetical protein [Comamonas testosteroni]WEE79432.1 hypothetical protein LZ683_08765 [Comamonas testosteroni]
MADQFEAPQNISAKEQEVLRLLDGMTIEAAKSVLFKAHFALIKHADRVVFRSYNPNVGDQEVAHG